MPTCRCGTEFITDRKVQTDLCNRCYAKVPKFTAISPVYFKVEKIGIRPMEPLLRAKCAIGDVGVIYQALPNGNYLVAAGGWIFNCTPYDIGSCPESALELHRRTIPPMTDEELLDLIIDPIIKALDEWELK